MREEERNPVLWSSKYSVHINWALTGWHYRSWYLYKHVGTEKVQPYLFTLDISSFPCNKSSPYSSSFALHPNTLKKYRTSSNMFGHQTARNWSTTLFIYKSDQYHLESSHFIGSTLSESRLSPEVRLVLIFQKHNHFWKLFSFNEVTHQYREESLVLWLIYMVSRFPDVKYIICFWRHVFFLQTMGKNLS